MKLSIRAKLVAGFLAVLLIGTVASVGALSMISRSVTHLQRVIDRDDVVALKAVQIRMAMLEMSDAMRGFLLDPTNQAEVQRKLAADSTLSVRVRELRQLQPSKDVLQKIEQAAAYDESTLNKIEEQILSLAKSNKLAEARDKYDGQYLSARGLHAALMDDMERLSNRDKQEAVTAAANDRVAHASRSGSSSVSPSCSVSRCR